MVHSPLADRSVVDEQSHLAAGRRLGLVGLELHSHGHLTGRELLLRDLFEDEHAHHRVGVGELSVLDIEREASEVICFGDDHALCAASGTTRSAVIEYERL